MSNRETVIIVIVNRPNTSPPKQEPALNLSHFIDVHSHSVAWILCENRSDDEDDDDDDATADDDDDDDVTTFFIKYVSLKIKSFFSENTPLNRTNTMQLNRNYYKQWDWKI